MTEDEIFDSNDNNNSQNNDNAWQGPPLFQNNQYGIALWPNKDKNGNWYLTLDVPLLNNVNLFANSGSHDGIEETWNRFVDNFNQK